MSDLEISNKLILNEIQKGNNELKLALQATEVKLTLKIEEINHRLIQTEKENEELRKKVEFLERNQKKNNIIIFGFERDERIITTDHIINFMKKYLKIQLVESDINNIYPLGQTYDSPVKIEFTSFLKKITVLKNAKNLKGTSMTIAQDLTEQQRTESKILRKHLKVAKQDTNNTCFIRRNRLHVNDRIFSPSDLEKLEEGSEVISQIKPRSDPGTPVFEYFTRNPEESREESTATTLPPTAGNKNSTVPETTSGEHLNIQITPKTGSPHGTETDKGEDKKVPPSDKFYRLRILLLIIGITSSLPMKFFITSNQYWMHKFRNPEAPNDSKRTELQANFTAASMAMQTIPSILTTYLALRYAHRWKIRTRIMLSLLLVITCFLFSTVFIKVDTDKWQTGFFILTMATLTYLSIISSILRFTLTVLISRFPQEYVKFYTIGHGTTGLLSAILQVIALSFGKEPIRTALIYFLCGTSILTVAVILFYHSQNLDLYQYYMNSVEEDTQRPPYHWKELKPVMWKMMPALMSIFTYEPTVYMFHPNLTNLIKSEYYWNGSAWSTKYFTPVITFLYSDALSLLGRSSGMPIITRKSGWIFILVCLFKMLGLAPLLAFCNAQTAHRHSPVWFPHDWQYILILGAFSYLSGFLLTSAYISIPNLVGKEVEKAYPLMQVAFTSITALSPLGILIVNVI